MSSGDPWCGLHGWASCRCTPCPACVVIPPERGVRERVRCYGLVWLALYGFSQLKAPSAPAGC